jgi:quercetin dioxygenase-like cupin family protein
MAAGPIEAHVVVRGDATGGDYALLELRLAGGAAVPAHVLTREDALVVVLDGAPVVRVGPDRHELSRGDHVAVPRGAPRAVEAPAPARLLCLLRPAGGEELADLLRPPHLAADDVAAQLAVAGARLLPPMR